jgi:hypothetical protein
MKPLRGIKEKVDAGDCLLAAGVALTGYGVYAVYGRGWAFVFVGAAMIFFAYVGQATGLLCSIFGARGQKK